MEIVGNYSTRNHASLNKFDSTDQILDEIDAKLNGVNAATSQIRPMDVNEDPGVDASTVRMFRQHMETENMDYRPSHAPDFSSIDCKLHDASKKITSGDSFHEKRTNLLQLYDDDINLLRRMLQENGEAAKPHSNVDMKQLLQNGSSSGLTEDYRPKFSRSIDTKPRLEETNALPVTVPTLHNPPPFHSSPAVNEPFHCTCGLEEDLEKMTKKRDELLARIRRGDASKTSIEERQELERQLHSSKTALFQQRKKSRLQLEDIEEKLEEAQHYYEEKLAEKEDVIATLQEKVESLLQQPKAVQRPPPEVIISPPPPDTSWMQEEMAKKDEELKQLSDLVSKQNQALNDLKAQHDSETKQFSFQTDEKVVFERKKWEEKIEELKLFHEKENKKYRNKVKDLESEREKLCQNVQDLNQKIDEYYNEIDQKEMTIKNESLQRESDYKATTDLLRNKIETLKEELSHVFASKSELELDFRRKETELVKENKNSEAFLKEENKKLENELQHMRVEVSQAVGKLKDFKADIENQDQSLATSIYDECQKLSTLLKSIQNTTNTNRRGFVPKGALVCKRAVCELQDIVDSVSRSANDLLCELSRLKRESRKRVDFASMRTSNDVTISSEEAKMLREKLNEKESELQDLQINMNHWKDLTAQRLAEKFQEELQLQVERKLSQQRNDHLHKAVEPKQELGRFSKSTNSLTNGNNSHGDTSTVKLLCHLQGRVKQLRTENDKDTHRDLPSSKAQLAVESEEGEDIATSSTALP